MQSNSASRTASSIRMKLHVVQHMHVNIQTLLCLHRYNKSCDDEKNKPGWNISVFGTVSFFYMYFVIRI